MGFVIDGIAKWSDRFRVRLCSKNNKYTFFGYVLELICVKIYQLFFVNKDKISGRQSSCPHIKYF